VKVIRATHIDDALCQGLQHLADAGVLEETARGPVIVAATPVTTHFIHPMNNASLCPIRDANPFFHLIEAAWMLAGRNDARELDPYIKGFSARVAEDGIDHGAYGYRWRDAFGFDQIELVIRMLSVDPSTRQAVIQMWDSSYDGMNDLRGNWKDRPCNTHIYFRVINNEYLDMTVCNRSNDIIWGAYGANAVHFGFLLQYMASRLGLKANSYYQVSNNFHAYLSEIDRLWGRISTFKSESTERKLIKIVDAMHKAKPMLSSDYTVPDISLDLIYLQRLFESVNRINNGEQVLTNMRGDSDSFLYSAIAHRHYRNDNYDSALEHARFIHWPNWREACVNWLRRRIDAKARKAAARELVPGE
jgi:thymidylate synthase